ncbi:flagellar motor protein MotB [Parafrankia colletiae]|uniref:Flagellar motor protein MotB n=1 Tax=Parafrankia colletiae TaxID=573497 RepID=A0A1S1QXG2_9ACTN|nr:OmpA family protein [Parafrankia colletiae]MCK9898810.1 OmpA family protein [Frankia sp. Cpl3]OHV38367.1 flagellar motor protein MotB [Parafrankia colletiae]
MALPALVCAAGCVLGYLLLGVGDAPALGAVPVPARSTPPAAVAPAPGFPSGAPEAPEAVPDPQIAGSVRRLDTAGSTLPIDLSDAVRPLRSEERRGGRLTVTISADVLFDFDSDDLTDTARAEIARLARQVPPAAGTVTVLGHTDSLGTPAYNVILSQRRADAVAGLLRPAVPDGTRVSATGRGGADPVAPNTRPDGPDDPAGRALNRRVEVSFPAG